MQDVNNLTLSVMSPRTSSFDQRLYVVFVWKLNSTHSLGCVDCIALFVLMNSFNKPEAAIVPMQYMLPEEYPFSLFSYMKGKVFHVLYWPHLPHDCLQAVWANTSLRHRLALVWMRLAQPRGSVSRHSSARVTLVHRPENSKESNPLVLTTYYRL